MNQGTILGRPVVKWIALAALVAVLVALLPGGLLQAQGGTTIEYMENGTDPVLTLSASDPETGDTIVWSLLPAETDTANIAGVGLADDADAEDFKVVDGVLTFNDPPDYETPSGEGDASNSYRVVVRASDGNENSHFKVIVNVQDLEEKGSVKLRPSSEMGATLLQPQVDVQITAHSVTDPDGPDPITGTIAYQWYSSSSMTDRGTTKATGSGAATATYTPDDADIDKYLHVVATYDDGRGGGKTATQASYFPTIARIASSGAPTFTEGDTTTRAVAEGTAKGTNIGSPVAATDTDPEEKLTYWLTAGGNNDLFDIDPMTGQLKVKTVLDSDEDTGANVCDADACTVNVNVADSTGTTPGTIIVTINVTDVNEKPTFSAGGATIEHPEGTAVLDTDLSTYTATDPDDDTVTLSLEGPDKSKFDLNDPDNVVAGSKVLAFKTAPDFETPGDANRDNVYQVTVKASDGLLPATRDVLVKVTDVPEDGSIAVAPAQPRVGVELTATLMDEDGENAPAWQWRKAATDNVTDNCPVDNSIAWTAIKDATSNTYTPTAADRDDCLRVEATYYDSHYNGSPLVAEIKPVGRVGAPSTNMAPMFPSTTATRHVLENAADNIPDDNEDGPEVGFPVTATDPDGNLLRYTLEGTDKGSFNVNSGGQITVKGNPKLDHETKPTLTVTVKADDNRGGTDTISVTIRVIDVDEAPIITGPEEGVGVPYIENATGPVVDTLRATDPEGATAIYWFLPESGDPDGDGPLMADDVGDNAAFKIDQRGVLTFRIPPSPRTYRVLVQASDGTNISFRKAVVNVTDKKDDGKVTLRFSTDATLLQPQVGVAIAASTTDDDGEVTVVSHQWYRSNSKRNTGGTMITGGTGLSYTPDADDVGKYLYVKVTYNDPNDDGQTAISDASYYRTIAVTDNDPNVNGDQNAPPTFTEGATATRAVAEGTAKGTNIGSPVAATDPDSHEKLSYWLMDGGNNDLFDIDPMTGQLKVKTMLNYEADPDQCSIANECLVVVNVTDSAGSTPVTTINVTINVTDVNEKPTFVGGGATIEHPEGTAVLDTDLSNSDMDDATYTAEDQDGDAVTLSLEGPDASKFKLNDPDNVAAGSKVLAFRTAPDFETPGDANRDNVYQVTVKASDGPLHATRDVLVKVTDTNETDAITVDPSQPRVGVRLTATLGDKGPDFPFLSDPAWQWRKVSTDDEDCPMQDADVWLPASTRIKDATSNTYTPGSDDNGYCLRVEAKYVDGFHADDETLHKEPVDFVLTAKVLAPSANHPPMFPSNTATRYVREDAKPNVVDSSETPEQTQGNVGAPVEADDPNSDDTLRYTLEGGDAGLFTIGAGQIQVKTGAKLDYETKPTLTVTVKADDNRGGTDTITVTIHVIDVDEAPIIMEGGLAISGPASVPSYTENGRDAVGTYTASGPEAAKARWTLEGADLGDFTITGGILKFRSSPDYEDPRDADKDNTYMVTVKANDGTNMAMKGVTVTVTNVDELGRLSGPTSRSYVENSTDAVGTYMADGTKADEAMWTLMGDDAADFDISTSGVLTFDATPNYEMPLDEDEDNTYMVTVKASAGGEMKMVDVTITVTDVDEGFEVSGLAAVNYAENGTGSVANYTAAGPDANMATWSLGGDDEGDFEISTGGVLTFRSSPDYEAAADDDTDNAYEVTVVASAGTNEDRLDVTVTVTDVDDAEAGDPLLTKYDADNSGSLEKDEVIQAINDYLFGVGADAISQEDVIEIINLYLFS